MSIQDRTTSTGPSATRVSDNDAVAPTGAAPTRRPSSRGGTVLAVLRIVLGLTFLWAFLDKAFGWGYATTPAQAWVNGGSPTKGFLSHVQVGPLQSMLRGMAGVGWVDWLFMVGLLGLGLALLAGIGLRLAAAAGTVLLGFMWIAEWPFARFTSAGTATSSSNPLIDYHLVYIVAIIAVACYAAGDTWGWGRVWAKLDLVRRNPWLR